MKAVLQKLEAPELEQIGESRAKQIRKTFEPMASMVEQFEDRFNEVIKRSEKGIDEDLIKEAKRLRLDIKNVRVETEKLRKDEKEEYLRAGKAIDGVANIVKWAVTEKENRLKEIENHFELMEKERLEKLQEKRVKELEPYVEDAHERDLATMEEEVWTIYLNGKKKEHEDRIEAERKAEEERKEKERLAMLHRERKDQIIPFWEVLKDDYKGVDYSGLSEEEFNEILEEAKELKESRDLELKRQRLHSDRMNELTPFINFVPKSTTTDLSQLNEKEFSDLMKDVKAKKSAHDKEQKRIQEENERLKNQEKEREEREQALKSGKDAEKIEALSNQLNDIQLPKMRSKKGQDLIESISKDLEGIKQSVVDAFNNLSK